MAASTAESSRGEDVCHACYDDERPRVVLRCGCYYCVECLESMVELAISKEGMAFGYRPHCCARRSIPLKVFERHISHSLFNVYRNKLLEIWTRDRTYCSNVSCARFVAPHSVHNGEAYCQECNTITCTRCHGKAHFGSCTESQQQHEFESLAKEKKWQRCPGCGGMIERTRGCPEMLCRCGTTFCYVCGRKFKESGDCLCETDNEYDIDDEDEEVSDYGSEDDESYGEIRDDDGEDEESEELEEVQEGDGF